MTNRGLAAGVFRAWGVMWLFSALLAIPGTLTILASRGSSEDPGVQNYFAWAHAASLLASFAIAAFLLIKAGWLAGRVFPQEESLALQIEAAGLQAILFSVVGLYFALDGVRDLMMSINALLTKPSGDTRPSVEYLFAERWKDLITSLAEIALGIGVFFGSRGLRNLWQRYRSGGPATEPGEPAEL